MEVLAHHTCVAVNAVSRLISFLGTYMEIDVIYFGSLRGYLPVLLHYSCYAINAPSSKNGLRCLSLLGLLLLLK